MTAQVIPIWHHPAYHRTLTLDQMAERLRVSRERRAEMERVRREALFANDGDAA